MRRIIKRTKVDGPSGIIVNIINTFVWILQSLFLIRILLRLFEANEQNTFVDLVYSVTAFFLIPFRTIFENIEFNTGMVLEINTLIAMIVYGIISWVIISLIISLTGEKVEEEFVEMD